MTEYPFEIVTPDDRLPIKIILHSRAGRQFVARHWHDSVEISYVLEGAIDSIFVDGSTYTSHKGDIVLINSNAIHSFSIYQAEDTLALTILIPYEFLKANYSEMDRFAFKCISRTETDRRQLERLSDLRGLLDRIVSVYSGLQQSDPLAVILLRGLAYILVFQLIKDFAVPKVNQGVVTSDKHLERLASIRNFIKQHYMEKLPIDRLANEFGLTGQHLSRFFQKHIGITIQQYVNAVRLEHAYRDLMNTDHSITHIVHHHGFPNEKSFNRIFKSAYEMTPAEYRKKHKNIKNRL